MATMLKRILKGGRDRTSKDIDYDSRVPYRGPNVTPSGINSTNSAWSAAVEYDRTPPNIAFATHTSSSITPAEYERVRPDVDPYMSQTLPPQPYNRDQSVPGVEYNNSSPTRQYPSYSIGPAVQYNESAPTRMDSATSEIYTDNSSGRQKDPRATYIPTAYNSNPPSAAQKSDRELRAAYPPVQYEPPTPAAITSPHAVEYGRQPPPMQSPYSHELGPPPVASPGMVSYGQTPVDGYMSMNAQVQPQPPPQRPVQQYPSYGNPGENAANQRPPYNYQEHNWPSPTNPSSTPKHVHQNEVQNTQSRFENTYSESGNSSASSLYNPPYSTASNSTAPTSIYSPDRPNFVGQNSPSTYGTPAFPPRNQQAAASSPTFPDSTPAAATTSTDDPNVSKFTVRIFCQRKRGEGDTHEESPRDIREFRLANLALIKLAAGGERYVLLDAVFGELDKAIAPLLEKHWYLTQNTTVEDHFVPGGKNVVAIGKIMVAYKGTQSTLYADFKKDDDYARFKMEMEYAMNTIRSNGSKKNEKEVQQYRY